MGAVAHLRSHGRRRSPSVRFRTDALRAPAHPRAMLHEFLARHRVDLVDRCRLKVAQRQAPPPSDTELLHGIPMFLDQLIDTLEMEERAPHAAAARVSGPPGRAGQAQSEIGATATRHGRELLEGGFTVEQVVHDYNDLCQAITELAFEAGATMRIDEFRVLNSCLDKAIADAVTEYNYRSDTATASRHSQELNERLGFFAHELRNYLNTAMLALGAVKLGNVGFGGATGAVLDRSLVGLRNLIDRSLAEVRINAGAVPQRHFFSLCEFISEVRNAASLEAHVRGHVIVVPDVDPRLAVEADRDMLLAAVGNLLHNAFKFTRHRSTVTLTAHAVGDRIRIDVEDCCGGLPPGAEDNLFKPFTQEGRDRSGLGLGLSISRRTVEANSGHLSVRNLPGRGCVFTIDLPRHAMPAPGAIRRALSAPADTMTAPTLT